MKDIFNTYLAEIYSEKEIKKKEENENEKPKERVEGPLVCNAWNFILAFAMGRSRPPWKQIPATTSRSGRCMCWIDVSVT